MNPQLKQPQIKYRKDYKPSTHNIEFIHLYIDINENITNVTAQFTVTKNKNSHEHIDTLKLSGEKQNLISVKVNNELLLAKDYVLTAEDLTILNIPAKATIEIKSQIKPQENSELTGLYKTNNIFCTQCEPHGFRRITYFLDRPDVLTKFTTTISADKKKYPLLLANGNLISADNLAENRHAITWEDPFLKPSYLFAMVAGDLDFIEDYFTTSSGRHVTLHLFCEKDKKDRCYFAMESLKKAMKWDEEKYGREYDLDVFMIVAVSDFNFGAMENKGLNIFNEKYILADTRTATDRDYLNILSVVGHEYFHNWSGNRVTLRDWFQLSLKEGFTVYRDQQFSEDSGSKAIERIEQVENLYDSQFAEDAGPLAHPVRPDSYMQMNNFYTATVYEKGAELIRMLNTILGDETFRHATDLYFAKNDGKAVTCDDFIDAMQSASKIDLTPFKLWYSQAGTPEVYVTDSFDPQKKTYTLQFKQFCPPTAEQTDKKPMHIPIKIALLDNTGELMPLILQNNEKKNNDNTSMVLNLQNKEQEFTFTNIQQKPTPSLLRGFSAPIKLFFNYTQNQLEILILKDSDPFCRWQAMRTLITAELLKLIADYQNLKPLKLNPNIIELFQQILTLNNTDPALIAELITLPSEKYLAKQMQIIDVDAINHVRKFTQKKLCEHLHAIFIKIYTKYNARHHAYEISSTEIAQRTLKNTVLSYLCKNEKEPDYNLALEQFYHANNMTDQFAAFTAIINSNSAKRVDIIDYFYKTYNNEPLVINKWLSAQAMAEKKDVLIDIRNLMQNKIFNIKNPNCARALLGAFVHYNNINFHALNGKGYKFIAEEIIKIDEFNPQLAASIVKGFEQLKSFDTVRQELMRTELKRILAKENLSKDLYELINKILK